MIYSRLKRLRLAWEEKHNEKLTYRKMAAQTGLSSGVIVRLMRPTVERVDGATLAALCKFFGCGVGDILEYVSDEG